MVDNNKDFQFEDTAKENQSDEALSNDTPAVASLKSKNTLFIIAAVIGAFFFIKFMTAEDPQKKLQEQANQGKTFNQEVKPEGEVAQPFSDGKIAPVNTASNDTQIALPPPPPPPPAFEPASIYTPAKDQNLPALPTIAGGQGGAPGLPSTGTTDSDIFSEANKARLNSGMFIGGAGGGGAMDAANDPNAIEATSADSVVVTRIGNTSDAIIQGKVIDGVLETAINTDLPGSLRAIVSRDVYAESGKRILIPKGSRLIGSYKSDVKVGQVRIYVIWSRIIRPDGIDAMLDSQSIDLLGRTGIVGTVDNKFFEIFSSSLLLSALTIGFAVAADAVVPDNNVTQGETGSGDATTSGNVAAISTQQAIEDFGGTVRDVTEKLINVTPRITVDQGTRIKIFVNRDIKFPAEYFNSIKFIN